MVFHITPGQKGVNGSVGVTGFRARFDTAALWKLSWISSSILPHRRLMPEQRNPIRRPASLMVRFAARRSGLSRELDSARASVIISLCLNPFSPFSRAS
jgi:hypothetical protein